MADTKRRIGLREVRALRAGETIYDAGVVGFAARRQHSEAVTYLLRYRTRDGRQRWHTIGRHGAPWTPDQARGEAVRILGAVARGEDPAGQRAEARAAETVAELCELYWQAAEAGTLLTRHRVPKKQSTLLTDRGRIDGHIKPLLGSMKVRTVTRRDVEGFMRAVTSGETAKPAIRDGKRRPGSELRGGRGVASRTVGLLGAIFTFAVAEGMRPDNPVRGVMRPADGRRERRLSDDEYAAFGAALQSAQGWPPMLAAIRFLALTGWRSGEARALAWASVDEVKRTAILADTKTGRSLRPLSVAACDVLAGLPMARGEHVFPGASGSGPISALPRAFAAIVKSAKLPADITAHVLRHSFASVAADLGYSEPTIAALIGHKGQSMTAKYIHSTDAVLLAAADAVADRIAAMMNASDDN